MSKNPIFGGIYQEVPYKHSEHLASISSNHHQHHCSHWCGQGDDATAARMASSIHAGSTPGVTHPYFVVVHAGSQNPKHAADF